jgi:hypothetical protein
LQEARGFGPERAGALFAAFSPEQDAAGCGQAKVVGVQAGDFADACAEVEHEAQEREVAVAIRTGDFHGGEHGLDFLEVEVGDFAGAGAFEGDGEDAPGLCQMFGALSTEIAEKAMDGTEADIAGAILARIKNLRNRRRCYLASKLQL